MSKNQRAEEIVRNYTLLAMATGAIPLPATSFAIVGESAAMISHVAAIYGADALTVGSVAKTLGVAGAINMGGRAMFIELARWVASFAAQFALPAVMLVGTITAGIQTWILGNIAIAIAESNRELSEDEAKERIRAAKESFDEVAEAFKRGERGKKDD